MSDTSWLHRELIADGKLPLALCFLAFVLTFTVTRTITRSIRGGRGPFHDNVTSGGTHIHHAVPGIILLSIGAFSAVGGPSVLGWRCAAGVLVGIGTSLVLDEFAMILHLQDVYWSGEGQLSVDAVSLTAACLGLLLVGFSPWAMPEMGDVERAVRIGTTTLFLINGVCALACAFKGKYQLALLGLFVPALAWIGAVRLGRPTSIWGRKRYRGEKLARATRRAAEFDRRVRPLETDWVDLVGGRPSKPDPT